MNAVDGWPAPHRSFGIARLGHFPPESLIGSSAFAIAYALFEIPSRYPVRTQLIRQWDNRAQPGPIEPLLERGEEDREPELARAM